MSVVSPHIPFVANFGPTCTIIETITYDYTMTESRYPKMLTTFGPLAIFEYTLRLGISFLSLIDSYQASILSMLYLYIILQLVGLLWAFVTNAAVSLGLMVAKEVGSADLSELSNVRKREMLATFYVFYSTFRVVMQFLNSCVSTVWQSLNDFPRARRQISGFAAKKATLILVATYTPIIMISAALIIVGAVCDKDDAGAKFSGAKINLQAVPGLSASSIDSSLDYFCEDSPFKYIAFGYHLPRRILTFVVVLSGLQFIIVILNQFPDWATTMRKVKKVRYDEERSDKQKSTQFPNSFMTCFLSALLIISSLIITLRSLS